MMTVLWLLAIASLLVGTGAASLALIPAFPVSWLYHHYFIRKPVVWGILAAAAGWATWATGKHGTPPWPAWPPLLLMGLAVVLVHRLHQEKAFPAVDFPPMAKDIAALPLRDDMELAVVEHNGQSRAYPLDYVIHHHIVNDRFGSATVALTYCAMCRSILAFDVTALGPLFVASFKHANMIMADRKTVTFFQQATAQSIRGRLHPCSLTLLPFQILTWGQLRTERPLPAVVAFTQKDLRAFELPIPGVWRRIVASEVTPGLPAARRDQTHPARTRVVGLLQAPRDGFYLKDELMKREVFMDREQGVLFVAAQGTVNAFALDDRLLAVRLEGGATLRDDGTGRAWDLRGHPLDGDHNALAPVSISDEYWFSWKLFHPSSPLLHPHG